MNLLFRNDDISADNNAVDLKELCNIFHQYGFTQLHGVTLYGWTQEHSIENGIPKVYPEHDEITNLSNKQIKELSQDKFVGDNKELVAYINSIPDPIALHGLYHYDYSQMTKEEQEADILCGLELLTKLFPKKIVKDFIAPYNKANEHTHAVCEKLGLKLHTANGTHLEALIHYGNNWKLVEGETYRYHHHRFYKDSLFDNYKLSTERLYRFFMHTTVRPLMSIDEYKDCIQKADAQTWYGYAYEKYEELKQCYLPYMWIRNNIARDYKILETGCGAGGVLHFLWHEGFCNLYGHDYDAKAIDAAKRIAQKHGAEMNFEIVDCTTPNDIGTFDVLLGMNWFYLIDGYDLAQFIRQYSPHVAGEGYLIFDVIDSSYNKNPLNMYHTQDWKIEDGERRPSEYKVRYSTEEVIEIAKENNLSLVENWYVDYTIPRRVFVFQAQK
ncbi:methyltransferase domain-containing protein [Maridesulfovibrio sp.]|uniref:methyltransferase domain-containing protein n=1 Tax=Maridesulfovibrio sp. TaxID=2795000 RepID=UPI0029F55D01|nr:methyltransferase domain-containing protein [Maridesulfovibrio sp.]